MSEEVWKHINGLPLGYEISSLGNARINYDSYTETIPIKTTGGYACINVLGKQHRIHICVAEAFVDNPSNKPHVNHIDGDRLNNAASNLEWTSPSENAQQAFRSKIQTGKVIRCVEDNLVFTTLFSASVYYSINVFAIEHSANSGSTCFGYHFEYVKDLNDIDILDSIYISNANMLELSESLGSTAEIRSYVDSHRDMF